MRKVTYRCNLCLDEKTKEELLAYFWRSDKEPQGYGLNGNLDSSDKHICLKCIKTIKDSK